LQSNFVIKFQNVEFIKYEKQMQGRIRRM